jgi:hypothetical protein
MSSTGLLSSVSVWTILTLSPLFACLFSGKSLVVKRARLSEEVLVLSAILECQKQGLIQNRQILIKHVADRINTQASYNEQWTDSSIGKITGRLGFERVHTNKGNALLWNEKLVEKLKTDPRYATAFTPIEIEDKDTPIHLENASLPSQGSPEGEENTRGMEWYEATDR